MKALAIEKRADGDFHSGDAALELKDFDLVGERFFVRFEHADHILAVVLFADEQAALHVLRFAARLDHVARGILHHVVHGVVEGEEFGVGDDVDAGFFQLFLAEGAIVLEAIRVGRAADHLFAGFAQRFGLFALAERIVEDDDVGPVGVLFPVLGLGDEAVADVFFLFVSDEIANLVAFLRNLPGDVADESRERHEQEILLLHRAPSSFLFHLTSTAALFREPKGAALPLATHVACAGSAPRLHSEAPARRARQAPAANSGGKLPHSTVFRPGLYICAAAGPKSLFPRSFAVDAKKECYLRGSGEMLTACYFARLHGESGASYESLSASYHWLASEWLPLWTRFMR